MKSNYNSEGVYVICLSESPYVSINWMLITSSGPFTSEKSSCKKLGKNVANSHDLMFQFLELEIISQYVRRSLSVCLYSRVFQFIDLLIFRSPINHASCFFFASPLLYLISRNPGQEIDYFLFHGREWGRKFSQIFWELFKTAFKIFLVELRLRL